MNEAEFIDSIDACFPYDDENKWKPIVECGINISDNAAYMVLYEICVAPAEIPQSDVFKILEYWSSRYNHPAKDMVVKAAIAVIQDKTLPEEEILIYLDALLPYPGLYNAASVLYNASPEWSERCKEKYFELEKRWRSHIDM
jgi:hypothetical protein